MTGMNGMNSALYSVKRHGVTISNCDTEPLHTPGCIQPHGVLLVLRRSDLTVAQVSENSEVWLGHDPAALLDRPIDEVLGSADGERVRTFLASQPVDRNPMYAFTSTIAATGLRLDVTLHQIDEVAMVELEQAERGEHEPIDCYCLVKRATARMQRASSVVEFCQVVADDAFELTRLDRVMIYRFLADGSGEVVAEAKRDDLHPWLGLRYPADDVPTPVRTIFRRIGVRPLPDARAEMMEMVPLGHPDSGAPLDMTYCALRGASVMYTEYLQNMGVAASLTMPLLRDGELWGMIACHHLTPTQFSYQVRAAAELLAQSASLRLVHAEQREHGDYRARIHAAHHQVLTRTAQTGELEAMLTGSPNLRDGIVCDAVALRYCDRWTTIGRSPSPAQLDELAAWLCEIPEFAVADRPVFATEQLGARFEPARAYPDIASGLLAIPLARELRTLILWFRGEDVVTIDWAGDPNDKPTQPGPRGPRLTPRVNFEIWREQARARAQPWIPTEVYAALELRYFLMDLVMSRVELLAELNVELARSNAELDAFAYVASHDLKEPLRGIHKHAHALLEELEAGRSPTEQSRARLDSVLQLTIRMDGLLDALLHFSRVGRLELALDDTPLDVVLREAIEMLGGRLHELDVELRIPRPLPSIPCDGVRVREIFANLISNALKYGNKPERWIEVGYIAPGEQPDWFRPELAPPEIDGHMIFYVRDNGLGIDPVHYERVFALFKRLHPRDAFGGGTGAGLTITKKLVEQHSGQIWLDSTLGEGTTFFFTLGPGGLDVQPS